MLDYVSLSLFFLVRTQGLSQHSKRRGWPPRQFAAAAVILPFPLPHNCCSFLNRSWGFSLLRFAVRLEASSAWQLSFWRSRGWTSATASHDQSFTILCTNLVNNTAAAACAHTCMNTTTTPITEDPFRPGFKIAPNLPSTLYYLPWHGESREFSGVMCALWHENWSLVVLTCWLWFLPPGQKNCWHSTEWAE